MKHQDPLQRLRLIVKQHGSQRAAAKALGITGTYLGDILQGKRGFSDTVLAKLGLARVEQFVEKAS